jgi:hypothetical protein
MGKMTWARCRARRVAIHLAMLMLLLPADAAADGNSLIGYPQSEIIRRGAFHLDVDTVGQMASTNAFTGMGITYGIGSSLWGRSGSTGDTDGFLGRAEIGADYVISAGGSMPQVPSQDRFYFNFKVQIYNDTVSRTRVVAGGYNLGPSSVLAARDLYVLVSKAHSWGKLQIGITHAFGPELGLMTPNGNADRTYLQASYNRQIVGRLFGAFAGYTGQSTQSRMSVAMAYYLDPQYRGSFAIGYLRYNDPSVLPGRDQVYFGFDYGWGGN